MAEYFIYHLRKTVLRFVVLAAILCVLANASVCLKSRGIEGTTVVGGNLIVFALFAIIAPVAVAGLEFSQFMNRRNLDTWFSLPISRINLFLTHFINGAVQLSVSFLAGIVVACAKLSPYPKFHITEVWNFFWVGLGLMLLLYMLLTFLFVCANNVFDGCVFMMGSYMVPNAIFKIVKAIVFAGKNQNILNSSAETISKWAFNGYTLYMEILKASVRYTSALESSTRNRSTASYVYGYLDDYVDANVPNMLLWTMISVAALAGAIIVFSRKRTEKVSGVSDSWFGYRTLIPIVTAGTLITSASTMASVSQSGLSGILSILLPVPTFVGVFIAYIIYRRGIKLKIPDLITMGALVVFYMVCVFAFKAVL